MAIKRHLSHWLFLSTFLVSPHEINQSWCSKVTDSLPIGKGGLPRRALHKGIIPALDYSNLAGIPVRTPTLAVHVNRQQDKEKHRQRTPHRCPCPQRAHGFESFYLVETKLGKSDRRQEHLSIQTALSTCIPKERRCYVKRAGRHAPRVKCSISRFIGCLHIHAPYYGRGAYVVRTRYAVKYCAPIGYPLAPSPGRLIVFSPEGVERGWELWKYREAQLYIFQCKHHPNGQRLKVKAL